MTAKVNRILSMLIDHISMCIIMLPVMLVMAIILAFVIGSEPQLNSHSEYALLAMGTLAFLPFTIYFLKDNYRGKSIGKRLMGYQVINVQTNETASGLQCFIRNLVIPLWPLEVLITLFSPTRRLGDLIADTKVIISEKEPMNSILSEIKQTKFSWQTLVILGIGLAYGLLLTQVTFGSLLF